MARQRAPKTEAAGTSGQSFVKAEFEELGWGAVPNPEHDLGTDLWLMARDERRFDLGALVGAQVKNGASYFDGREAVDDEGKLLGWWYPEADDSHFEYWSEHTTPHILVLRDPRTRLSYWVHVRRELIESTGKGNKILVPADQLVDEAHREALTAVATSPATSSSWDGSAWNANRAIPNSDLLRYAMVTPRLVAPHPNASVANPSAAQALALLTQLRVRDIDEVNSVEKRAELADLPDPDSWTWKLFDAAFGWLLNGELAGVENVLEGAREPRELAAAAVLHASALVELGRVEEAFALLQRTHANAEFGTVDDAWLTAQEARCVREMGDQQRARDLSLEVQSLRAVAPGDPTAMAVVAAASFLVFNLSDWGERSVADLVASSDTVSRWWRSQVIATGLGKHFDEGFKSWGRDTSITFGATDVVWTSLRSATLLAGFSADHGGWQHSASLLARRELMVTSHDATDHLQQALDHLRLAGADKDTALVVKKFDAEGPVEVLTRIASELDLDQTPRSAIKPSLTFLRHAGDVVAIADADRHAAWALNTLENVDAFRRRINVQFLVEPAVLEVLAALMLSVSGDMRRRIIDHVLAIPVLEDQLVASSYARVIRRVEDDEWTDEDVTKLAARVGDNFEFANRAGTIVASRDPEFRASLLERIREGDLAALGSFGNVRDLPGDVVTDVLAHLASKIQDQISEARRGAFGLGGYDYGSAAVLLNAWHSDVADWDAIEFLFAEPRVHPDHVTGAIDLLGRLRKEVPEEILQRLKPLLTTMASRPAIATAVPMFETHSDVGATASLTIARCFPQEVTDAFLRMLLRGEQRSREAAVRVIVDREDPSEFNLLCMLANDADLDVRAAAAEGLARWVARGLCMPASREVLRELLATPGTLLGERISRELMDAPEGEARELLMTHLERHPSALVRARVSVARSGHL